MRASARSSMEEVIAFRINQLASGCLPTGRFGDPDFIQFTGSPFNKWDHKS
jgi:hypothetical protein